MWQEEEKKNAEHADESEAQWNHGLPDTAPGVVEVRGHDVAKWNGLASSEYDCVVDLAAFIDRYDQAWNEHDVDAIMSMHASDMVFENHTRGVRAEGEAVRALLESTFAEQPDLRFRGRRRYVGADFVVSEWTATATDADGRVTEWDGIDVFPFRDGLIARKDVYSGSHAPRVL